MNVLHELIGGACFACGATYNWCVNEINIEDEACCGQCARMDTHGVRPRADTSLGAIYSLDDLLPCTCAADTLEHTPEAHLDFCDARLRKSIAAHLVQVAAAAYDEGWRKCREAQQHERMADPTTAPHIGNSPYRGD